MAMIQALVEPTLVHMRSERDLYLRLLRLTLQSEIEPLLEEALSMIVNVAGAHQGYIELHGREDDLEPSWQISHGFSLVEIQRIREQVSSGIIAETLSSGNIINTQSARLDPRFRDRESVKAAHIEAVLCVPIESDTPRGALYLQGREDGSSFSRETCESAVLFAHHLAPLVENILLRTNAREVPDATAIYRDRLCLDAIVGRSPALASLFREIAAVAPLNVNVLLTGESGTGKSQIAKSIHDSGPRAGKTLIELNCTALPEPLMESELFGSQAESHSTATRSIPGKVASAFGGTLLLDEVGELALNAQAKLLHLLQAGQYYPLGADKAVDADVRIIAATTVDLEEAVRRGDFREDLYYRLRVLPIRVPTLLERRSDLPELVRHFCEQSIQRHGLPMLEISPGAMRAIETAEWPGNIRQLENAVQAGAIRAAGSGSAQIEELHIFPADVTAPGQDESRERGETFQRATRRFQSELLARTLAETGWNVSESARRLDLTRSHVYNLIKAFRLNRSGK